METVKETEMEAQAETETAVEAQAEAETVVETQAEMEVQEAAAQEIRPGRWATGESCGWAFWSPVGTGPQSGGGFPPG